MTRAPIPFQFELHVDGKTIDVGQSLDRRLHSGDANPIVPAGAWPRMREAPDMVFAVAACLALASDDWSNAYHFAEMALRAVTSRRSHPAGAADDDPAQRHELKYLYALAERFRIGEMSPPFSGETRSKVKLGYDVARVMLDECVEFHERQQDTRQRLRLIRALSERAALHLFYAAGVTPAVRFAAVRRIDRQERGAWDHQRGATAETWEFTSQWLPTEARRALGNAEADLRRCLQYESLLPPELSASQRELFQKLEQQFLINIAAAEVLGRLLDKGPRGDAIEQPAADGRIADATIVRRIAELHAQLGRYLTPLLETELLAFLSLHGEQRQKESLLQRRPDGASGKSLSLDLALTSAIRESESQFAPRAPGR